VIDVSNRSFNGISRFSTGPLDCMLSYQHYRAPDRPASVVCTGLTFLCRNAAREVRKTARANTDMTRGPYDTKRRRNEKVKEWRAGDSSCALKIAVVDEVFLACQSTDRNPNPRAAGRKLERFAASSLRRGEQLPNWPITAIDKAFTVFRAGQRRASFQSLLISSRSQRPLVWRCRPKL
jgi:hypothetical protein